MSLNPGSQQRLARRFSLLTLIVGFLLCSALVFAQSTVGTSSIVGTVTDQSGAVVSGARVTIVNAATGQTNDLTTNNSGAFNAGSVPPGTYKVTVTAKGFSTVATSVSVQVGNTATANIKMNVGQESQTIEVQASDVTVNTEQATVQGVLNSAQIENLPVNGRNFLDLAQLEPGVQIQDGQNFDPTKAGYSSISFGGRFGRTARVNVDGVDVSDETVGTTTADIPASAIDEFQLSQSSLDLSNDLTSSGAVNVTTKSGTNAFHGEAFEFIRDHKFSANVPGGTDNPFQRNQFGGKFGGPLIKNKLFFFLDGERTKQDAFAAVLVSGPLSGLSGGFSQPFRESNLLGRLDYDLGHGAKAFYRYSYFANLLDATFGFGYSVYANKDYTRNHVAGIDFNTGSWAHSIRFSYLKFQNQIADATVGNPALPLSNFPLELRIGGTFFSGPNLLAPQSTPQSNRQVKYDGSKTFGRHIIRYGASYNRIQGGGFADFFGLAPRASTTYLQSNIDFANCVSGSGCVAPFGPGGDTNPLNYPVTTVRVGNGLGFNTEHPALGFPAGGLGPDNRMGLYIGDSWKVKPNFTVNAGLRYDRDTGRTDSDLPAIPEINAVFPGFGNRVRQPNMNFAPQIGIAYDPFNNGKTVIRAGIGLFYENVIFNNVLFDRPLRLRTGAFNQTPNACVNFLPQPVPTNTGTITPGPGVCSDPNTGGPISIGAAGPAIAAFQQLYQSQNPPDLSAVNPNFVGSFLDPAAQLSLPIALFAPNYRSPRSLQMNVGIQREIRRGMVLTADYLRNVSTHTLLGSDVNDVGDVRFFDATAATNAITTTNASFGCGPGGTGVDCAIAAGASMADYATHGLTSPLDFGAVCSNATTGIGAPCAFAGKNPNAPQGFFLFPVGRALYQGLQMKLTQNVNAPMRGVKAVNFQVAYSLSRFENSGGAAVNGNTGDNDQDFVIQSGDNNNVNKYFGPSLLDRTHQISFGGYIEVPFGFRFSIASHFYSPLSGSLIVPNTTNPGEIFRTDFTGDGTVQDPLPGTHFGQFDRGTDAAQLTPLINNYNGSVAGQPTPAGQVLIKNGLMSLAQLQALGGVAPTVPVPVANEADFTWLRAMDLKISWRHTFHERFTVEPNVGIYNLANFSNFNLPPTTMLSFLDGNPGSVNGTSKSDPSTYNAFRVGNGTGVYGLGAPRQIEFGLRLIF